MPLFDKVERLLNDDQQATCWARAWSKSDLCDWPKILHGWKTMLLRSTFMGPSQISADPIHRPFSRIPAKPNQVAIVAIHELSFRKFRKMGRMTSFVVVSLIEISFPFYEWYNLRLFSFNTITQSSIYTREEGEARSEEGGARREKRGGRGGGLGGQWFGTPP